MANMTQTAPPPPPGFSQISTGAAVGYGTGANRLQNSLKIASIIHRLNSYILKSQPLSKIEAFDFKHLLISLSKEIDYALTSNEIPDATSELTPVIKKICQLKSDPQIRATFMVLLTSLKFACKIGWFSAEEIKDIGDITNEVYNGFSGFGDANILPTNLDSIVSTIMTRFYPRLKIGQILGCLEIKPGYGAYVVGFLLTKSMLTTIETVRLLVAKTDDIETSACLITPQQASFLANGREINGRNTNSMESGPLMTTNLNGMLKCGSNLIQAIGQFTGHYVIVVAIMTLEASQENPVLQDYVQPNSMTQYSEDLDIIEGPFRVSLNCPIRALRSMGYEFSHSRIKVPVKGHSCKHPQCFDFNNFININSRRPSWRCPGCNQHVCYTDIRLDQNMAKILSEVGDNVAEVIISSDGSWRAVLESDGNLGIQNNTTNLNKERSEQQESDDHINSNPTVLDLTTNNEEMDVVRADEIQDTKPQLGFQSNGSTICGALSSGSPGACSVPMFANQMTSPVLTDAISPAPNQGAVSDLSSLLQHQYSAPGSMSLQMSQLVDPITDNEYGRNSFLNRHNINRSPIAVQALPATSQTTTPQQRSNPMDIDRAIQQRIQIQQQLQHSRSHLGTPFTRSDIASTPSQHHSATQVGPTTPATHTSPNLVASSRATENHNMHQWQTVNARMSQFRAQSPASMQVRAQPGVGLNAGTGTPPATYAQQAAAQLAARSRQIHTVPVQVPTYRPGPTNQARVATGGPTNQARVPTGGPTNQARVPIVGAGVQATDPIDLSSEEQDWRPASRMRGSLTGSYSPDLRPYIILPTQQQAQQVQSPIPPATRPSITVPSALQAYLENRVPQVPQTEQVNSAVPPTNINEGSNQPPGTH